MGETIGECKHITVFLEEANSDESVISKYKTVLTWNVNRSQSVKNPAKRRKVSLPHFGNRMPNCVAFRYHPLHAAHVI